jgi:hypothetical protein
MTKKNISKRKKYTNKRQRKYSKDIVYRKTKRRTKKRKNFKKTKMKKFNKKTKMKYKYGGATVGAAPLSTVYQQRFVNLFRRPERDDTEETVQLMDEVHEDELYIGQWNCLASQYTGKGMSSDTYKNMKYMDVSGKHPVINDSAEYIRFNHSRIKEQLKFISSMLGKEIVEPTLHFDDRLDGGAGMVGIGAVPEGSGEQAGPVPTGTHSSHSSHEFHENREALGNVGVYLLQEFSPELYGAITYYNVPNIGVAPGCMLYVSGGVPPLVGPDRYTDGAFSKKATESKGRTDMFRGQRGRGKTAFLTAVEGWESGAGQVEGITTEYYNKDLLTDSDKMGDYKWNLDEFNSTTTGVLWDEDKFMEVTNNTKDKPKVLTKLAKFNCYRNYLGYEEGDDRPGFTVGSPLRSVYDWKSSTIVALKNKDTDDGIVFCSIHLPGRKKKPQAKLYSDTYKAAKIIANKEKCTHIIIGGDFNNELDIHIPYGATARLEVEAAQAKKEEKAAISLMLAGSDVAVDKEKLNKAKKEATEAGEEATEAVETTSIPKSERKLINKLVDLVESDNDINQNTVYDFDYIQKEDINDKARRIDWVFSYKKKTGVWRDPVLLPMDYKYPGEEGDFTQFDINGSVDFDKVKGRQEYASNPHRTFYKTKVECIKAYLPEEKVNAALLLGLDGKSTPSEFQHIANIGKHSLSDHVPSVNTLTL